MEVVSGKAEAAVRGTRFGFRVKLKFPLAGPADGGRLLH
jgi:hypothetical protein